MDGPGVSLFQGSDLKFSNSFQHAEEEEVVEENRKREAELKDLFKDAFDDLNDDEDDTSSIASSQLNASHSDHESSKHLQNFNLQPVIHNFKEPHVFDQQRRDVILETIPEKHNESSDSIHDTNHPNHMISNPVTDVSGQHYTHCYKNGISHNRDADLIERYKKSEGDYSELKVLYEIRMREIERLRKDVDVEREAKEEAIHHLALSQSDKNKVLMELSNYKDLFSKSKDRISELEESVEKMKLEILELEKAREKDDDEVKIAHQQVICLEQKIAAMERCDLSTNRMKQMDAFVESLKLKHQKELTALQDKIDTFTTKLEQKDRECRALESKLDEVERKRAALVLEKCDGAARQENALQMLLNKANDEKIVLNRQIVSLQSECASLKDELEQYESVAKLRLCLGSSSDESGETGRPGGLSQLTRTRSSSNIMKANQINPHYQDIINNLRDELQRALLAKAAKRHEINKLQEQVRSKEIQIQEMKERERVYLSQADSLKADFTRIVGQLSENKESENSVEMQHMKSEIDRLLDSNKEHLITIDQLITEIDKLKSDMNSSHSRINEGDVGLRENELAQLKSQSDQLLRAKEMEWRAKLELVIKDCNEIKQLYMNLRNSNGRLTDQMELQKQQISVLVKDKDQIVTLLKEKELVIDKLKEENIKFKVENEIVRSNNPVLTFQDKELVHSLESEIEKLKAELFELPVKHTKELEGLKNELEAAKLRLIELDKRLRNEFESEMSKVVCERDRLKELIKNSASSPCDSHLGSKEEVGTMTDYVESNLKSVKDSAMNDILEKRLEMELSGLEKRLISEHKTELVATEERIKSVMSSYYNDQIAEIKCHFEGELSKIIENEQKKLSELTELLNKKDAQIQQLENNDLAGKIICLQKKIENDRIKFSETIKHWSVKVEHLKNKISDDENKLLYLNQNLKAERKDAQKYKAKFTNAKKRIQQEKLENMLKIKTDFDNLKSAKDFDGKRMNEKEKLIEIEYSEKENMLKHQYNVSKK